MSLLYVGALVPHWGILLVAVPPGLALKLLKAACFFWRPSTRDLALPFPPPAASTAAPRLWRKNHNKVIWAFARVLVFKTYSEVPLLFLSAFSQRPCAFQSPAPTVAIVPPAASRVPLCAPILLVKLWPDIQFFLSYLILSKVRSYILKNIPDKLLLKKQLQYMPFKYSNCCNDFFYNLASRFVCHFGCKFR